MGVEEAAVRDAAKRDDVDFLGFAVLPRLLHSISQSHFFRVG
jgi:hypothetical protein